MLLAEAADAVISRFAVVGLSVARLPFNPVELFEEPERLFRWTAPLLPCLECVDEAPPRMGHASKMRCPFQRAPGGITVAHHDAAVIAEEGLRVYLAAARLIIEQHDRLVTVLAAPVCPHVRGAGGLSILFLQHLDRGLVTMDEGLRS